MSQTPMLSLPGHPQPFGIILKRVAVPFVVFAGVLLALLVLSWFLLLPRLTRVAVGGERRTAEDVMSYRNALAADIQRQEEDREAFVLPFLHPQYETMKRDRDVALSIMDVQERLEEAARSVTSQPDAVHLYGLSFDANTNVVSLRGDVRFVGPSSMTVLAQFVETLRSKPFVAEIREPQFQRLDDADIGPHSPFEFSFRLP